MKIFGAVLVIISSYAVAQYYILLMRRRIKTIDSFIKFLSNLQTRINYEYSHFIEIFKDICERENGIIADFLRECLNEIEKGSSLKCSWDAGIDNLSKQKRLLQEDCDVLKDFAKGLGESDIDGQKSNLLLYIEILNSRLRSAERNLEEKSKITVSGCVFCALFLVVLLI